MQDRYSILVSSFDRMLLALALVALAGAPVRAGAQSIGDPHLKVELVSEGNALMPGQDIRVGLHFKMDERWHLYWLNPGDSGQPPSVQWELPPGFEAGPIEWPYPQRLEHPPLVDYGYEGELLLPMRIHSPRGPVPGRAVDLSANVKWLVCSDICIPGKARVTLSLPVRQDDVSPDPAPNQLFEDFRRRLPRPLPPGWRAMATSEKDEFLLSIYTGRSESKATFFPSEAEQIENAAPQIVTASNHGIRIRLKKSAHLLKSVSTLNGVVVFPRGQAYWLHAKVSSTRAN